MAIQVYTIQSDNNAILIDLGTGIQPLTAVKTERGYSLEIPDGLEVIFSDSKYVKIIGDTMTGTLNIETATEDYPNLVLRSTDNVAINNALEVRNSANTGLAGINALGKYLAPVGNVSTPSISFWGDPNTGIYSPAADQVAMVGGGVERWTLGQFGRFALVTDQINANAGSAQSLTIYNNGSLTFNAASSYVEFQVNGTAGFRVLGAVSRIGNVNDSNLNATMNVGATGTGTVGMIVKAIASMTANLFEWKDSANNVMLAIAANARDFILDTTTGTKIGTAVTQKLGFWNATPVTQPASANQAAITNSTGGTANGTMVDVTTAGVADPTKINDNLTELHVLLNQIRTDLVTVGIIKGSA